MKYTNKFIELNICLLNNSWPVINLNNIKTYTSPDFTKKKKKKKDKSTKILWGLTDVSSSMHSFVALHRAATPSGG